MATGCWCTLKIHLPGEKARHEKAVKSVRRDLELAEAAEKRGKK
jgi:hypothetical protein